MALNFPTSPSIGTLYPSSPPAGMAQYRWDGEKWSLATLTSRQPIYDDGSIPMSAQLKLVGSPVAGNDAAQKAYVDSIVNGYVKADGTVPMTGQLKVQATPVATNDAASKVYVDGQISGRLATAGGQNITGGFSVSPYALPGSTSFTVNPLLGNYQYMTNNGAFTLSAPTVDCGVDILFTNGPSAGGITMAGFTYASSNYGDPYTLVNGARFIISIRRIAGISTFTIKALQ